MSCHHHADIEIFSGFGEYGIIITLFLTGLVGSFSHCIYMCGPIALGISNMRLMSFEGKELTEANRLKLVLCLPYYFGKALTYTLLALFFAYVSTLFSDYSFFRYIAITFLLLMSLSFAIIAFSRSLSFGIKLPKSALSFISRITKGSSYGLKGFLQGMVLGLIPCGLVLSSITTAITYSESLFIVGLSMFSFGIATFPALFIVSYFGNFVQNKMKGMAFNVLFMIVMLFNAYLLLRYALKLI